jgi:hypothetical protein
MQPISSKKLLVLKIKDITNLVKFVLAWNTHIAITETHVFLHCEAL